MTKRRRRRKKAIFNPEEFLPKQVISKSDLKTKKEKEKPVDKGDKESAKHGTSRTAIGKDTGSEKQLAEELKQFHIEDDLFELDEDSIGDITLDAGFVSERAQVGKIEETPIKRKEEIPDTGEDVLKLGDLLDIGTSIGQIPIFARIAGEEILKESEPAETIEAEEEVEEEPESEIESEIEISMDSLSMPRQDLKDMFKEELIREDVFSRLDEMEIEKKEEKVEEVIEEKVKIEKFEEEITPETEEKVKSEKDMEEAPPEVEEEVKVEKIEKKIPESIAPEDEETPIEKIEEETPVEKEEKIEKEPVAVDEEIIKPEEIEEKVVSEVKKEEEKSDEADVETIKREAGMKGIDEELDSLLRDHKREDISFREEIVSDTVVVYRKKRKAEDFLKEIEEVKEIPQKVEEEVEVEAQAEKTVEETETPEEETLISAAGEIARESAEEKKVEELEEISPSADEIPEILEEEEIQPVSEVPEEVLEKVPEEIKEIEPQREEIETPIKEKEIEEPLEPVADVPVEVGDLYKRIDRKFTTELTKIRTKINDILSRIEILEGIKEKMKTSMPELKEYMDHVAPEIAEIPEIKIPEEEIVEIPEIPEFEAPKIAEPVLSAKEKKAIKKEVDDLLKGFKIVPIEKEIGYVGTLVRTVPILSFLKPRLSEIILRGDVDNKTLVGLHRIASRFLKEELMNKQRELRQVRGEFKKFKTGTGRLEKVLGKRGALGIAGREEKVSSADEGELFMAREESKKKDKIIAGLEKQLDRMRTDYSNMRARQRKDIEHKIGKFKEEIIIDVLSSVDNFQRALDFSKSIDYNEAVVKGFEMTYDDMLSILKKYNLEEIPAKGQRFDPFYHEAILFEETLEYPDGTILEEIRKGYMINGKLARPSQVKVAKNPQAVTADGEVEPQKEETKKEEVKKIPKKPEPEIEVKKPREEEVKIEVKKKEEEPPHKEKRGDETYTIQAFFGSHLNDLGE